MRCAFCGWFALLLGFLAPAAAVAGPAPSPPLRVVSSLRLATASQPYEQVKLAIPLTPALVGAVAALRSTPAADSEPYQERLETLLQTDARLSLNDRAGLASDLRAPPRLQIAEGVADLTLEPELPVLWRISDPEKVDFEQVKVPAGVHLTAVLHASDLGVDAASPLPLADDGDANLRWSFGPGSSASAQVTLHDSLATGADTWAQQALYFLAAILPMAVFALLLGRIAAAADEKAALVPSLLITLAAATAGISLALYFQIVELQVLDAGVITSIVRTNWVTESLRAFVPGIGAAAFACLVPGKREERAARAVLALVPVIALALCVPMLHEARFGSGSLIAPWALEAIAGLAGLLLLGLVVEATLRWLDFAWAATGRGATARATLLGRAGRLCIIAVALVVAGGQLCLALHLLGSDNALGPAFVPSLEGALGAVPVTLANLSLNLATPIFALVVTIWLWQRAAAGGLPLESSWEAATVALVFATIVIGVTGTIHGYPAPFPFFASFLSIAAALLVLARGPRAALAKLTRTVAETDQMLDRWLALKEAMKGGSGDGEAEAGDQAARRGERAALLDLPALEKVPAEDRARTMLELGLGSARTAPQRLRLFVDRGWWLVVVPLGYSALLLIEQQGSEAISDGQPFGLVFLAAGLFNQSVMWVVAAACFLLAYPILPGRVGALKGLFTGVFVGLPWLLVRLLNSEDTSLHATYFIPAVLTLLFVAIGCLLDYRTVRRRDEGPRELGVLYSMTSARSALAAASVLVVLFTVAQGLANGEGATALGNAATKLPGLIP